MCICTPHSRMELVVVSHNMLTTAFLLQNGTVAAASYAGSTLAYVAPQMAGAIDIMVVSQPDGSLRSSPFYGSHCHIRYFMLFYLHGVIRGPNISHCFQCALASTQAYAQPAKRCTLWSMVSATLTFAFCIRLVLLCLYSQMKHVNMQPWLGITNVALDCNVLHRCRC